MARRSKPASRRPSKTAPGVGVDAGGGPLIDPTRNVLDLVAAAMKRQDDLRDAQEKMAALRAHYDEKLRQAESDRINAIRAVDVEAVQRAAQVSTQQASTLAAQVTASAETLRTSVQAAATAQTVALANALEPLAAAIADLRKTQYEAQGVKAQVVENRDDRRDNGIGTRAWIGIALAATVGFSSFVLGAAGIVITLLLRSK